MENQTMLKKTAFGGFDRKSVLNYVYDINTSAKEAQDKLLAQLEEITSSREKVSESLREMETKLQQVQQERDDFSTELGSEKQRTGELAVMMDSLNAQIAKQERILAEKEEEIADYKRLNNELLRKNETLESKKQEVEKASAYVGELLLRTQVDSEKILADAAVKAQELVVEAGKSLEGVHSQFESFKQEMSTIQDQIQQAMQAVQDKFSHIGKAVKDAEVNLRDIVYPKASLKLVQQEEQPTSNIDTQDEFFRSAAEN